MFTVWLNGLFEVKMYDLSMKILMMWQKNPEKVLLSIGATVKVMY